MVDAEKFHAETYRRRVERALSDGLRHFASAAVIDGPNGVTGWRRVVDGLVVRKRGRDWLLGGGEANG